jgi:putative chitinase
MTIPINLQLAWNTTDDLDLEVIEPGGEFLYYGNPTSSSGGKLVADLNPGCNEVTSAPTERIFWTLLPKAGNYNTRVNFFRECRSGTVGYTLTMSVLGDTQVIRDSVTGEGNADSFVIGLGDAQRNLLTGGSSGDWLIGAGGSDTLRGGGGSDRLTGMNINERGVGEIDVLTGGSGKDTFVLATGGQVHYYSAFTPITADQLKKILPQATATDISKYLAPLNNAMKEFEIHTPERQQAFIAQFGKECTQLKEIEENFRYSVDGAVGQFGGRFSSLEKARKFFKDIFGTDGRATTKSEFKKFANRIYANWNGNGDEASGDGYRFRGRGLIHLTGREEYRKVSQALSIDLEKQPWKASTPDLAARVSASFWVRPGKRINKVADRLMDAKTTSDRTKVMKSITQKVTGSKIQGLDERLANYNRARQQIRYGNDYAEIKDFNRLEDVIQLSGSRSDYRLVPLFDQPGFSLRYQNDVIAVISGNVGNLSLTGSYFQF